MWGLSQKVSNKLKDNMSVSSFVNKFVKSNPKVQYFPDGESSEEDDWVDDEVLLKRPHGAKTVYSSVEARKDASPGANSQANAPLKSSPIVISKPPEIKSGNQTSHPRADLVALLDDDTDEEFDLVALEPQGEEDVTYYHATRSLFAQVHSVMGATFAKLRKAGEALTSCIQYDVEKLPVWRSAVYMDYRSTKNRADAQNAKIICKGVKPAQWANNPLYRGKHQQPKVVATMTTPSSTRGSDSCGGCLRCPLHCPRRANPVGQLEGCYICNELIKWGDGVLCVECQRMFPTLTPTGVKPVPTAGPRNDRGGCVGNTNLRADVSPLQSDTDQFQDASSCDGGGGVWGPDSKVGPHNLKAITLPETEYWCGETKTTCLLVPLFLYLRTHAALRVRSVGLTAHLREKARQWCKEHDVPLLVQAVQISKCVACAELLWPDERLALRIQASNAGVEVVQLLRGYDKGDVQSRLGFWAKFARVFKARPLRPI